MLAQERMIAFLGTTDAVRARTFFEGALGLSFAGDHGPVVTFEGGAWRLMLQKTDRVTPPYGTALGWHVADLRGTIRALVARGVEFERGELPQDELGIWSPVPGQGVAWFLDPDGNRLSLNGDI